MSEVRTIQAGSRITVAVDNTDAEAATAAALAAATSVQQIGEQVEARADEALGEIQDALGAYALTVPPGFPYAPPGAPVTFPEGFTA